YLYIKIKEIIRSIEETDELIESNKLFENDNNEIEIFNVKFDIPLFSNIDISKNLQI
ncbi:3675_t:CDS:1, partial [Gigaspora margarita]